MIIIVGIVVVLLDQITPRDHINANPKDGTITDLWAFEIVLGLVAKEIKFQVKQFVRKAVIRESSLQGKHIPKKGVSKGSRKRKQS